MVPDEMHRGAGDARRLGLPVTALHLDGRLIPDAALGAGQGRAGSRVTPVVQLSQPMPSWSPSKWCGSGSGTSHRTGKFRYGMSLQSRSGGGDGMQTVG